MLTLRVNVKKLNKRLVIPESLPDTMNIIGVVNQHYTFRGEKVETASDLNQDKWFKDQNGHFYWGGGLDVIDVVPAVIINQITPAIKRKIEQVVNVFETGSANGKYHLIAKHQDYNDPDTGQLIVQVTYGRSQTTEFGHLKTLIHDYVTRAGLYANTFQPYIGRVGQKPSLALDAVFCDALKNAGRNDPIMRDCQDKLFEKHYFQPALEWFTNHGFTLPLSLLVIYDSFIHSGRIPPFLRERFAAVVPKKEGDEKEWIRQYVTARHDWLATHKSKLLRKTVYRTKCFKEQIASANWDLSLTVDAHGTTI